MVKGVMLVDDDLDDVEIFQEALGEVDSTLNFYTAKNGRKAIEFLQNGENVKPDLIFLDINMPEMSGWQCLGELKATSELKEIPVIMYSTSAGQTEKQKAISLGAVDIYQKPERFEKLVDLLERVIKHHNFNASVKA